MSDSLNAGLLQTTVNNLYLNVGPCCSHSSNCCLGDVLLECLCAGVQSSSNMLLTGISSMSSRCVISASNSNCKMGTLSRSLLVVSFVWKLWLR